jgi:purine nucleosidase
VPIVLDCDPGHDDAVAIMLAAGCSTAELVAITTVAGNHTLEHTTRNACAVATVAGIDVPIAAGCDRPLLRPLRTAPEIHGESGLDGPEPVQPTVVPIERHAVELLVETVMDRPGEIVVVATGPLTNLALALRLEPRLASAVARVVLMGGAAATRGNVTPAAEFNIYVDPEAAAIVFDASWPLTMVGLDVTHQALCTRPIQERLEKTGAPGRFIGQLINYYRFSNEREQRWADPPVHDPVAVAVAIDPSLCETRPATVDVETVGAATAGMTVVEFCRSGNHDGQSASQASRRDTGPSVATERTALVAVDLHVERFWTLVEDALVNLTRC